MGAGWGKADGPLLRWNRLTWETASDQLNSLRKLVCGESMSVLTRFKWKDCTALKLDKELLGLFEAQQGSGIVNAIEVVCALVACQNYISSADRNQGMETNMKRTTIRSHNDLIWLFSLVLGSYVRPLSSIRPA
jgi:hypothetical protein